MHKIEGRYTGAMTIGERGQERALNFSLKILYDRATGVGTAKGTWQLTTPPEPDIVGAASGELIAVVTAAEVSPPHPDNPLPDGDLQLHGLLTGAADPPDPDLPAQQLVGNFAGTITDGTLNFAGAVGDPTGLTPNPAALLPAVKC